jgi:hypothetical protein
MDESQYAQLVSDNFPLVPDFRMEYDILILYLLHIVCRIAKK